MLLMHGPQSRLIGSRYNAGHHLRTALELVRQLMAQLAASLESGLITRASRPSFQGLLSSQDPLLCCMGSIILL